MYGMIGTPKQQAKRQMRNPQAHVGKVIRSGRWQIPDDYACCAMTGKLHRTANLECTVYVREVFGKQFLLDNGIYVEEADWLSEEGYGQIMDILYRLDLYDFYIKASFDL